MQIVDLYGNVTRRIRSPGVLFFVQYSVFRDIAHGWVGRHPRYRQRTSRCLEDRQVPGRTRFYKKRTWRILSLNEVERP